MERCPSHEYVLSFLVTIMDNYPPAVKECIKFRYNVKDIVQRYMNSLRNSEYFVSMFIDITITMIHFGVGTISLSCTYIYFYVHTVVIKLSFRYLCFISYFHEKCTDTFMISSLVLVGIGSYRLQIISSIHFLGRAYYLYDIMVFAGIGTNLWSINNFGHYQQYRT